MIDEEDYADLEEENARYHITPLGLLTAALGEHGARNVLDTLELHMRRHYSEGGGTPAIVLDENKLLFTTVSKGD